MKAEIRTKPRLFICFIMFTHFCICTCVACVGRSGGNIQESILLCEAQGLNSGHQVWQQASLPTEQSHQPQPRPLDLQCGLSGDRCSEARRKLTGRDIELVCIFKYTLTLTLVGQLCSPPPCQGRKQSSPDLISSPPLFPHPGGRGPSVEQHQATGLHAVLKKAT